MLCVRMFEGHFVSKRTHVHHMSAAVRESKCREWHEALGSHRSIHGMIESGQPANTAAGLRQCAQS